VESRLLQGYQQQCDENPRSPTLTSHGNHQLQLYYNTVQYGTAHGKKIAASSEQRMDQPFKLISEELEKSQATLSVLAWRLSSVCGRAAFDRSSSCSGTALASAAERRRCPCAVLPPFDRRRPSCVASGSPLHHLRQASHLRFSSTIIHDGSLRLLFCFEVKGEAGGLLLLPAPLKIIQPLPSTRGS